MVSYYVYPGIVGDPLKIVTRQMKINAAELWKAGSRRHSQARAIVYYLENLKGNKQIQIAQRYHQPRQSISSAIIRLKYEMQLYPVIRRQVARFAEQCNLKNEFENNIKTLIKQ